MKMAYVAALALACASPILAQAATSAPAVDLQYATPIAGDWVYARSATGGESSFRDPSGRTQLTVRCTRATRRVSIAKAASGAAPFLFVWTSSLSRSIPASFQPTMQQLVADVAATDPVLDAMAFSRGRLGISVTGQPAFVVPSWEELARVVEDCRT